MTRRALSFRSIPAAAANIAADAGTAYNRGSVTKLLTATAVMQLVENGIVGLDDPVVTYVPEIKLPESVTIRRLLSHSSGLRELPVTNIIGTGDLPVPGLDATLAEHLTELEPRTDRSRTSLSSTSSPSGADSDVPPAMRSPSRPLSSIPGRAERREY